MNPLQQQIEALFEFDNHEFDLWYREQKEMNPYIMRDWFINKLSLTKQSLPAIIELIEKDMREKIREMVEKKKYHEVLGKDDFWAKGTPAVDYSFTGKFTATWYNGIMDEIKDLLDNLINKE